MKMGGISTTAGAVLELNPNFLQSKDKTSLNLNAIKCSSSSLFCFRAFSNAWTDSLNWVVGEAGSFVDW